MRDRSWRIWKGNLILKKRIKRIRRNKYFPFYNNAYVKILDFTWVDFISAYETKKYRSIVTDKWDTRWKTKYSPNRSKMYWRGISGKNKTTRELERAEFHKIKQEYGI